MWIENPLRLTVVDAQTAGQLRANQSENKRLNPIEL